MRIQQVLPGFISKHSQSNMVDRVLKILLYVTPALLAFPFHKAIVVFSFIHILLILFSGKIKIQDVLRNLTPLLLVIFFYTTLLVVPLIFNNPQPLGVKPILGQIYPLLILFIIVRAYPSVDSMVKILYSYISGVGIFVAMIFGYDIFSNVIHNTKFGYSDLYIPIFDFFANSPGISILLAIPTLALIHSIIHARYKYLKLILMVAALAFYLQSFFFGGRAFYLLVLIGMIFTFLLNLRKGKQLVLIFVILVSTHFFHNYAFNCAVKLISSHKNIAQVLVPPPLQRGTVKLISSHKNTVQVLAPPSLQKGIKSARYELWFDGIKKTISGPSGGFTVDRSIVSTYWFHNVWLDCSRIAGWFALLPLIIINIITIYRSLCTVETMLRSSLIMFQIVTLAAMFQDIIIEGFSQFFIFYILLFFISATQFNSVSSHLNISPKE